MTTPYQAAAPHAPPHPAADLPHLLLVARNQRGVMNCILASIVIGLVSAFLPDATPAIVVAIPTLVLGIISLYFIIRLANAVFGPVGAVLCALIIAASTAWVVATANPIGRLIPLVVLAVVNGRATNALKKAGFKVGLMGGDPKDVEKRMQGIAS